jgi:hypothetical protein
MSTPNTRRKEKLELKVCTRDARSNDPTFFVGDVPRHLSSVDGRYFQGTTTDNTIKQTACERGVVVHCKRFFAELQIC